MAEATRTRGGNAPIKQELDQLVAIAPRRAGSEAERRAARHLQKRLQELGREAELEPTRVRPAFALAQLVNAVVGIVGSVISVYSPAIGLVLVLAATISAFGDLTGTFPGVRALFSARASQNVVSEADTGKPGRIVLVAHYDAPRSGMLFSPRFAPWPRVFLGSLGLITLCSLIRLIGVNATGLTVVQFIPTVVLIASTPLFADAAISDIGDGGADNAAGVAIALRLASRYSGHLKHFDVTVVFTGASAHFALGMRAWLRRHRKELDPQSTAVICLDNIASGEPVYASKDGAVLSSRMHPLLTELATETGSAEPFAGHELSDAYLARSSGLPALRISTSEGGDVDEQTLAKVKDFTGALMENIDREVGPLLG
jgi:hypothetical protein